MTTAQAPEGLEQFKQRTRATWAAGDFPAIARRELWPMGRRLVDHVGIRPGDEVLDVACGTGNAAIRAAEDGGHVTGVDLTPELFDAGRAEAATAGVTVDFVAGDAEALPFADASYDVVLSVFGCMFAPRHEVTAQELARVLRPGGRLGVLAWTPGGGVGTLFRTIGGFMPPGPPWAQPPLAWGDPDHVRALFAGTGITLDFDRGVAPASSHGTPEEEFERSAEEFGPMIMARHLLEPQGRWDELREAMVALFERDEPMEYLVIRGTKGP